MQSIAARTLNEVFRHHVIQLALTFHAGMEVLAYEWGAPSHGEGLSPDDVAQAHIAGALSRFGGSFDSSVSYRHGTMNDLVYPVRGGFEDWAYAGSWDTPRVAPCQPSTYGGYPVSKTTYDNATLRAFNILVETSNSKIPWTDLGTSRDVFHANQAENGHVSRNVRVALLAVELVQPWASIRYINTNSLADDAIPHQDQDACRNIKQTIALGECQNMMTVQWDVGGSLRVHETRLWYAK